MERLNGGEFLLDLTPITIEESTDSETYTNITNAKVLEQLTNLKRYIPNEKAIKPVWVKFVNDETDEIVVVKGELAKTSGDEEFEIHVKTKGYELTIHIEFTQAVNDNSDPIDDWYIDTNDAKYLFLSNTQTIGAITSLPVFENIVDKDGNKRFVEGDINLDASIPAGVTKTYGKWSLSGSHLMFVLGLDLADTTSLPVGTLLTSIDIPSWIKDKIFVLWNVLYIDSAGFTAWGDDWSSQTLRVNFIKNSQNQIVFSVGASLTLTATRHVRIAFDLLIDNE